MDLFREVFWVQQPAMWSGNQQFSPQVRQLDPFENISWIHQQSSSVVGIGIISMNQQWRYLAETAKPLPQLKSAGGTWRDARRSSRLCLSQQREDQRRYETNKHCTASSLYISKPSSVSFTICGVLFAPSKHHSMGLASTQSSVSADITLPISPSLQNG